MTTRRPARRAAAARSGLDGPRGGVRAERRRRAWSIRKPVPKTRRRGRREAPGGDGPFPGRGNAGRGGTGAAPERGQRHHAGLGTVSDRRLPSTGAGAQLRGRLLDAQRRVRHRSTRPHGALGGPCRRGRGAARAPPRPDRGRVRHLRRHGGAAGRHPLHSVAHQPGRHRARGHGRPPDAERGRADSPHAGRGLAGGGDRHQRDRHRARHRPPGPGPCGRAFLRRDQKLDLRGRAGARSDARDGARDR